MHVSGHKMVEWVQEYACAKLSENIWLAGGWVFHGGDRHLNPTDIILLTHNCFRAHACLLLLTDVTPAYLLHACRSEWLWKRLKKNRKHTGQISLASWSLRLSSVYTSTSETLEWATHDLSCWSGSLQLLLALRFCTFHQEWLCLQEPCTYLNHPVTMIWSYPFRNIIHLASMCHSFALFCLFPLFLFALQNFNGYFAN
jgi:hypothetical protein